MKSKLIYLHIEKTAGTSMRTLLFKNYEDKGVFWYGIDSDSIDFDESELSGQDVIGGHKIKPFYDALITPKIFLSIVREPIDRAVSLFNYYANIDPELDVWIERGFNPQSLELTLKECPKFAEEIANRQCVILSGSRSMEAVKQCFESEQYIVGTMDGLPNYISHLSELFEWPHGKIEKYNTGGEGYRSKVDVSDEAIRIIEDLNAEDAKLYQYISEKGIVNTVKPVNQE